MSIFDHLPSRRLPTPDRQSPDSAEPIWGLLEALPGLVYIFDLHANKNIYVNYNVEDLLGYDTEYLRSLGDNFFPVLVHPDDVKAWYSSVHPQYATADDKRVIEFEYRIRHANGEWRWFATRERVWRRAPDGTPQQIVAIGQDITERMRAEHQLRVQSKLVENVNDAVIVTDLHYVVQAWNPAAEAIYGWRAEEIVGMSLVEYLVTEFVDDDYESSVRMGQTSGNWHGEVRQKRKDGTFAHIFASISLVTDMAGTPVGWIAINRDISEEKAVIQALAQERTMLAQRVEERTAELQAANAEMVKASRLKDEFLATVSHEFRTPLQAILGFTENLSEGIVGPTTERQQRYLKLILDNSRHLLALINDILEFTKTGASPTRLDVRSVTVAALCEGSIDVVRSAAQRKRQHIALALAHHDLIVAADERIVKQILVNLLSNAVKFTGEGGAIGLEAYTCDDEARLCLTVWDTGIGIAEQDRDRLFQPFVQLDSGLNRQYDGTGLGLALAARLAAAHGGNITVESTPGVGSRFTLAIPLRRAERQARDVPVHR